MSQKGLTLVELVVVLAVIGIMVTIAGFSYQGWMTRYKIEAQTKELYSDLMDSRAQAITRNQARFAVINSGDYRIYADTNDDGSCGLPCDGTIDLVASSAFPKTVNFSLDWGGGTITLDKRGMVSPTTGTIRITHNSTPDYDCVSLSQTRIIMGLWDGTNCVIK